MLGNWLAPHVLAVLPDGCKYGLQRPAASSARLLFVSEKLQAGLGQAVRARREKMGLSQREFSKQTGVHFTYVSNVESGQRNPSLDVIETLAEAFGVRPSTLVREAEKLA